MSWNVSPPEPAADMSKTSLPANTAIAQPALAGRWLLPVSLALLVISLAAMPLLDRISAYTLIPFAALTLLAVGCAWRMARTAVAPAGQGATAATLMQEPSGLAAWRRLLLGVLPVWRRHLVSSRTQLEDAFTDLVLHFASITDEFEAAGFRGAAGAAAEQDDATGSLLNLCEQNLRQVIASMNEITQSKGEMSASMHELSQATKDLQTMAQGVAQIAAQTNLLAINAAIEAAHAGDAGRGFATIAKEIRSLSQSSAETASQITGRIARVTAIMQGTSATAAKAALQEETAIERSSGVVTEVLTHMHQLNADSHTMRERGNAIRGNIEQLIVTMQFQDRVNQLLGVVDADITRLRDEFEGDAPAPEPAQWLQELERHYTMREQRQHAGGEEQAAQHAPATSTTVFF
jgi:methyl-accepting chemotaxis protein